MLALEISFNTFVKNRYNKLGSIDQIQFAVRVLNITFFFVLLLEKEQVLF